MLTPESWLLCAGGLVFVALGITHAAFTLSDTIRPSRIVPFDPAVMDAMQGSTLRLTRQTTMWRAWVGFNFSHALGATMFGGLCVLGAIAAPELVSGRPVLPAAAGIVALLYLLLAVRYWFSTPRNGVLLALACFVAATVSGLA